MKTRHFVFTNLVFLFMCSLAFSQEITQNIRGKIIDTDSKSALIGANIIIIDSNPFKGAVTDVNGYFLIEGVALGRISLKVSYLGYEEQMIPNIMLGSGKELILDLELTESLAQMEAVEIIATQGKGELNDDMAMISARSVSVEETKRYAGSFDDPARMVSAFAGVNSNPAGNNDIVVRGNSPRGILWRMEGVEITNPNHFSDLGSTAGAISALNASMLANSDFYTGAFAPSYGNALSGIFDIQLRQGNYSRNEYKIGVGTLGIDFTMEGPFKKGKTATYLFNYRYSSLSLLDQMNLVDFGGVPKYQDLSFHVVLPTKKAGTFSFFGLGGISGISEKVYDVENEEDIIRENNATMYTGNVGLKHIYLFSEKTFLESIINVSGEGNKRLEDDIDSLGNRFNDDDMKMNTITRRLSLTLNHKINVRNKVKLGFIQSSPNFDLYFNAFDEELGKYVTNLDALGSSLSSQSFISWKHRFNERLSMVAGLHYMYFDLSKSQSFEPRIALDYEFSRRQYLTAGCGVHSRLEPITTYFTNSNTATNEIVIANTDLEPTKARHYVLGYKNRMSSKFLGMIEIYYQHLYEVPVENDVNSSYSTINVSNWFPNKLLVNEGTGENYGIELTLERYFTKNYYFLITSSFYQSKYTAFDGVQRNSRFNGNYIGNLLVGREFLLGKKKNKVKLLSVNLKLSYAGGQYYTPIDLKSSIDQGTWVDSPDAYSEKGEDIFQMNFAISYRVERKKTSQIIKLDALNATNNQAKIYPYYDSESETIRYETQLGILPNLSYIIEF